MTDQSKNDIASHIAFDYAQKTFANRNNGIGTPIANLTESFSNLMNYGDVKIALTSDGIGTKVEVAERMNIYDTLGFDLIAMIADDLVSNGFEPINLTNILDVNVIDEQIIDNLMKGLNKAANFANMIITGGEIAELGNRISGFGNHMHFNWCATGVGILPKNCKCISGESILTNQKIIALKSHGLRSNGFSLGRMILESKFGNLWHLEKDNYITWGNWMLTPSLIYAPIIIKLLKAGCTITGIAHITGGGIPSKFGRILKVAKKGAILDNLFEPDYFMLLLKKTGNISWEICFKEWNMGNGMLLIVPNSEAESTVNYINLNGYESKIAGHITEIPQIIVSTGNYSYWFPIEV